MSLWSSYKNFHPRTRLYFGVGLMGWAAIGIYASDHIERFFGLVPSEEEKEKTRLRLLRVEKGEVGGKD